MSIDAVSCWLDVDMLEIMKQSLSVVESGSESRVNPYRAAQTLPNGYVNPMTNRSFVVFGKFMKLGEVYKRLMLNREMATWVRNHLFSQGVVREVSIVRDCVLRMVNDALAAYMADPFNEDRTQDTVVAFNSTDMQSWNIDFADRVFSITLSDTRRATNGNRVLLAKLSDAWQTRNATRRLFEYVFVPHIDADGSVVDVKQLTEADTKSLVAFLMQTFFSLHSKQSITREFFTRQECMRAAERKRQFNRQLENTIANNVGAFEDMLEPNAPEILWLPRMNLRAEAFLMITHERLGVRSAGHEMPGEVLKIIVLMMETLLFY